MSMFSFPVGSRVRLLAAVLVCAVLPCLPRPATAQDPTSWVQALDSPDWRVRADAMNRLNRLALADLPASFRPKAIALLEREGTTSPGAEAGEGYGEYVIGVVEGVLRLNDPAALRGLALVGITTSRSAQEFVAAQGGAALTPLDEAWQDENSREAVGETWALMLGDFADRLSTTQRLQVIQRMLSARVVDAQAFTNAADDADLIVAIPVVEDVAATDPVGIIRTVAASAASRLRNTRAGLAPTSQLERLSDALAALCLDASGARGSACQTLASILADARNRLATNQESAARDALITFVAQVDAGFRQGTWTVDEQRILGGSSGFVISQLIATIFLHGSGGTANPPTLSLSSAAPTATDASYKDSPSIAFSGGNTWKEVGTWQAAPAVATGTLSTLGDAHVWLGLKNSDDQGTNFDVRIEVAKNGTVIASGQALCVQGVTRNAANAKEVVISFGSFAPTAFNGTSDVLTLRVTTRIGTTGSGASCGGHSNAVGVRLYFDATTRTSRFDAKF